MMAGAERLLADYTGHMCHLGPPAAMADKGPNRDRS